MSQENGTSDRPLNDLLSGQKAFICVSQEMSLPRKRRLREYSRVPLIMIAIWRQIEKNSSISDAV
jgi:hypothetical protein